MIKLFTASWCTACTALKNQLTEEDLVDVEIVDADNNPNQVVDFSIRSLPTVIKLEDGEEVDRVLGNMTRKAFLEFKGE